MDRKIYVGTSGWHYKYWVGNFYPANMQSRDFTAYYLRFFRTVEINNSFYKLPSPETFAGWYEAVPPDFLFTVKASRYITHMKKLKDPQESTARFFENIKPLAEKTGPVLFQLPPMWKLNYDRLENLLKLIPNHYRYTFEFRDRTWYTPEVYALLRKYNAAFCIYELAGHMSPLEVTADFLYIRLHGPTLQKYQGSYCEETLRFWAEKCLGWQQQGKDVFIYFDNDQLGYAGFNAQRLQEIIRERDGGALYGNL